MVLCRSISQDCVDGLWKELCGTLEEGVLEKYKVDEANKGGCPGRKEPLDWRIVKRENRFQPRMWREDCWAGIFSWLKSSAKKKACRQEEEEEEEVEQPQKASWWVSDLLAVDGKKSVAAPRMGGHSAAMVQLAA